MLDEIDIAGLAITTNALLTQRRLVEYIVTRGGHYHFTVKSRQQTLLYDVSYFSDNQDGEPDYSF